MCGEPAAAEEKAKDEQFENFLRILREKGFFAGVEEGSEEYNKRMKLAEENFGKMRAASAAAPAPAAAAAVKEEEKPVIDEAKAEALKAEGNEALKAGNMERAVELYNEAIKYNPNNAIYHCNLAAALLQLNRNEEAVSECEKAIAIKPDYARSYSRLGTALHKLGRYQEALDRGYKKALELEPTNETVKENLEVCQRDMQNASAKPTPGGMPNLGGLAQMMQDPKFQENAKNLAKQLGLEKEGEDGAQGGGMPSFDPSKMADMMSNPMVQQMMNNPAIQQMFVDLSARCLCCCCFSLVVVVVLYIKTGHRTLHRIHR